MPLIIIISILLKKKLLICSLRFTQNCVMSSTGLSVYSEKIELSKKKEIVVKDLY